jgi:hypothetical protein
MDMQDKEFDQLFSAKLDNFEAEPTGQVWDGIVEGLDGKRRYKMLVPYLSIAASIIVLAAAGILFIPQKTTVNPRHPDKNNIAKTTQPVSAAPVIKPDTLKAQPQNAAQQPAVVNSIAVVKHVKPVDIAVNKNPAPVVVEAQIPVKQQEQPVLAAVQQKQDVINPVLPDNSISLATKPALTANALTANNKPDDAAVAKPKRKAHGIGGLLNAVIATVDKRKDKLIEFTDSDDDETNVMSINLGAFKSKRERDK